jgi:D-alanyl-D-alanine carboxypeptidase
MYRRDARRIAEVTAVKQQVRPLYLRNVIRQAGLAGLIVAGIVCNAHTQARAEATLLIDADTGKVLQSENATYPWYPASTTKLMTAYIVLKAVKEGRLTLDTPFTVSAYALSQPPTKMGFKVGTTVTVDNALKMLMVKSANDMAVVLAEGVSGSVENFSNEMNATAARLGMTQSNFVNPNGLPADGHISSARDLAMLARAIFKDVPEYNYYWHLPGIKFGRRVVRNYNRLIDLYPGADGMKTGFICASGFNLVASATRDNRRLIAVVLGAPSSAVRAYKAAKMLEQGFKGDKLSWLMPSLGTVDQLKPIVAEPPNLREEMCGPKRKRPAAEDEEVDMSAGENGEPGSPLAFMLSSLHGTVKASQVLAGAVASLPPVEVFIGAFRPKTTQAAEAQESQLAGGGPKKAKAKKGKTKTAAAPAATGDKAAEAKPEAAKADAAKPEAAKPAAKPAAAKTAAVKPEAKPAAAKPAAVAPKAQ